MKSAAIKAAIEQGAAEITRLHARIHETVRFRDSSPQQRDAWKRACAEFHSRYSSLAFPGGYDGAIERIKASALDKVVLTNSISQTENKKLLQDRLDVLEVGFVFAEVCSVPSFCFFSSRLPNLGHSARPSW